MRKKGGILIEDVVFIVLNLIFLSILFLFVHSKASNTAMFEENYAKQIALMIDTAKPGMQISLDMQKPIEVAKKERGDDIKDIVTINENVVNVKISEGKGYSYSFFNDVKIQNYYISTGNYLVLFIEKKEAAH